MLNIPTGIPIDTPFETMFGIFLSSLETDKRPYNQETLDHFRHVARKIYIYGKASNIHPLILWSLAVQESGMGLNDKNIFQVKKNALEDIEMVLDHTYEPPYKLDDYIMMGIDYLKVLTYRAAVYKAKKYLEGESLTKADILFTERQILEQLKSGIFIDKIDEALIFGGWNEGIGAVGGALMKSNSFDEFIDKLKQLRLSDLSAFDYANVVSRRIYEASKHHKA